MFVHLHSLFFKPRESIKDALREAHTGVALFIVLLPALVTLAQFVFMGIPMEPTQAMMGVIRTVLGWIIVSLIFYIGIFLVKGKQAVKTGFGGIATAFSVGWIFLAILGIVTIIFTPIVYSPGFTTVFKIGLQENLSQAEIAQLATLAQAKDSVGLNQFMAQHLFTVDETQELQTAIQSNQEFINMTPLIVLIILGLLAALYVFLIVPYMIVSETANLGFIGNFLVYLVLIAITGLIGNFLMTI